MTKQQKSKKHHFVPVCYLKNFMSDGDLYTLDIVKVKDGTPHFVRRAKPAGICYIENYYAIPNDKRNSQFNLEGLDELFIESRVLTILEEKYSKVIYPKLSLGKSLLNEDVADLCDFILQLKFRNPFHFESMRIKMPKMVDEVMASISSEIKPGHRFGHIPIEIREIIIDKVKQDAIDNPLFSKQMQLSRFVEEAKDPDRKRRLRQALLSAKWLMLESPKCGPFFITSDNPGFAIGKDRLNYNTKFIDGFMFYFPISPTQCLLITDTGMEGYTYDGKELLIEKVKVDTEAVILINDRAIQQVNRLLIASDDEYLSQISQINQKK